MNSDSRIILRRLLQERSVAALGTLHDDEPYVSMVPFAITRTGTSLIVHASRLAAHTQNMMRNVRVSVLVSEPEGSQSMPQSLARVTIQGTARLAVRDEPEYPRWREAYLKRFPSAAPMFEFADFNLFLIEVVSARLVAGFAQAVTLDAERFAEAVGESTNET
jgi:putative heme iron utilization protein